MSMATEMQERRRFTVDEVLAMVDAGILTNGEPVELIRGELLVVSPQGPSHRTIAVILHRALQAAFGDDFHVQAHSPVVASTYSMPEPDIAVVRGDPRDYMEQLPSGEDIPLAAEVSVASAREDKAKADIYAAAGIPCYWQLNVPKRQLVVYRAPDADGYGSVATLTDAEQVDVPGTTVTLSVADLLP